MNGTIGVPLVLSSQQHQEVLHLHHAVMGAVVRHDCRGRGHKIKVSVTNKCVDPTGGAASVTHIII